MSFSNNLLILKGGKVFFLLVCMLLSFDANLCFISYIIYNDIYTMNYEFESHAEKNLYSLLAQIKKTLWLFASKKGLQ